MPPLPPPEICSQPRKVEPVKILVLNLMGEERILGPQLVEGHTPKSIAPKHFNAFPNVIIVRIQS